MKKLKLDLDKLQIETFETKDKTPLTSGTVIAHDTYDCPFSFHCGTEWWESCYHTCGHVPSCWLAC